MGRIAAGDAMPVGVGVFAVACIACLVITPVVIRMAIRHDLVDRPDHGRKWHRQPVACLGGPVLLVGWIAGIAFSGLIQPHVAGRALVGQHDAALMGIMLGAGVVMLTGLIDDLWSIRPRHKLLGQVIAAAVLVVHGVGTSIPRDMLNAIGGASGFGLFAGIIGLLLSVVAVGLVVLFVLGGCNAMNLLDGADGLAGSVAVVAVLGLTVAGASLTDGGSAGADMHWTAGVTGGHFVLCLASVGALLGFHPYNARPARIFLGDAGSMFLGYLCVALILFLAEKGGPLLLLSGLTIFALPILDTALAIVRRKLRGVSIARPDTYHLHHLFRRAGFGVRRSVMLLRLLAVGFAALGCAMLHYPLHYVVPAFVGYAGTIAIVAHRFAERCYIKDCEAEGTDHGVLWIGTGLSVSGHLAPASPPGHRLGHDTARTAATSARAASESEADFVASQAPRPESTSDGAHAA
jgi:UDP-GlcNAc:undecaprenyl-phosphate GlcNAc-1-phosphate transferase